MKQKQTQGRSARWTVKEIELLELHYPTKSSVALEDVIGRRAHCIHKMAQTLGVKKEREFFRAQGKRLADASHATRFLPRHGESGDKSAGVTYNAWQSMIARCTNPRHKSYAVYGGAGISVCARWRDYVNFLADMGDRPPGRTLDRWPDGRGNYEPGNCRWATPREQARNRASTRILTAYGVTKLMLEHAADWGIRIDTLTWRLKHGKMSPEKALSTPVKTAAKATKWSA